MELRDLLGTYNGKIDVFLVMEDGKSTKRSVSSALGSSANFVYFTPATSHRVRGRRQSVRGNYDSSRPAVISDISWWKGNAFRETLDFLQTQQYEMDHIYGFFKIGNAAPDAHGTRYYQTTVFNKAENILRILPRT